jgi:segregation and condensation protein B
MKRELEALLFATEAPLSLGRLKSFFPEVSGPDLRQALDGLREEYQAAGHAFTVVEFGGGWQIATRPEFSPLVEKLFRGRRYARLSRPALEVLAIIAYRQPVTRLEIEDVRGVQSSGVLATLMERNLVTVVGRAETVGHPLLYGTTRDFLNYLGLKGLSQLPRLPELEGFIDDREELKRFARELGEELSDQDLELYAEDGGELPEPEDDVVEIADAPDDAGAESPLPEAAEASDAIPADGQDHGQNRFS